MVRLTYKGNSYTLTELSDLFDVPRATIKSRYHKGWPIEKIISNKYKPRITTLEQQIEEVNELRRDGLRYRRKKAIKALHNYLLAKCPEFLYPKKPMMVA